MDMNGLMIAVREIKDTYLADVTPERNNDGTVSVLPGTEAGEVIRGCIE